MNDVQRIVVHDLALVVLIAVAFIGGRLHHPSAVVLVPFALLFGASYCAVVAVRR